MSWVFFQEWQHCLLGTTGPENAEGSPEGWREEARALSESLRFWQLHHRCVISPVMQSGGHCGLWIMNGSRVCQSKPLSQEGSPDFLWGKSHLPVQG